MTQLELANMTWKQATVARDRGAVVLIPVGTLEQNGSISPLASDTLIALEVAKQVARETGSVVVPPVNYGVSTLFSHFPGTVSIRPETLRMLIVDMCDNLIQTGFHHLVMINCHIYNEPIMEQAAREIRERRGVVMASFNPISLAQAASKDLYAGAEAALGHGSEPIASMLRSFAPESVWIGAAEPGGLGEYQGLPVVSGTRVRVDGAIFNLYFDYEDACSAGGTGDPTASDPERGAEIMRRVVTRASSFVRAFASLNVQVDK